MQRQRKERAQNPKSAREKWEDSLVFKQDWLGFNLDTEIITKDRGECSKDYLSQMSQ